MATTPQKVLNNLKNIILDDVDQIDRDLKLTPRQIKTRIFLTSFSILFFELICIRWIPAYVRYLAYFMNFVMLAAFLGMGLGIMASRRKKLLLPTFSIWLFLLIVVIIAARFELYLPSTQVLYYAAGESIAPPENGIVLPIILIFVVIAFIILSRPLGKLLTAVPPLQAYTWDIIGSLAGIVAFFFMSYLSLQPGYWFSILCILVLSTTSKRRWVPAIPFLLGSLIMVFGLARGNLWSPYYRINIFSQGDSHQIYVNNVGHQVATHYLNKENFYFRVYDLLGQKPFKKVLVLGAGAGSDVAIALNSGAEKVDAVEIDPVIYKLGVELHPDHPYDDPRVKVYIDDGRSFLRNSNEKYDLIIFALPDSLTLTSSYSSLRLESFLLTTDAFESAARLLTDDGALVLYNYYREDWLVRKIAGMVNHVFDAPPFVTTYGAYGRAAVIIGGPRLAELDPDLNVPYTEDIKSIPASRGYPLPVIGEGTMGEDPSQTLATDNWPFIYMPNPTIPTLYLGALGILLLIALSMIAIVVPGTIIRRFNWHFFFLGVAFMLLEARSLVTFGLLFGNTWMINSLVFFAILSSVLLAILFNARVRVTRVWPMYALLLGFLVLNYFLPLKSLLDIREPVLRYGLASLLAFAPIFIANVVFSHSFRDSTEADIAFASNLLGAVLGGICEYAALAFGYQALLLFVIVFYAVSYLTNKKQGSFRLNPVQK